MVDNYQWRYLARVVAYVDLAFFILALTVILPLVLAKDLVTQIMDATKTLDPGKTGKGNIYFIPGILAFAAVIELWASVMLFSATKPEAEVKESLCGALIWRNLSVAFFIIWVSAIIPYSWIPIAVGAVIRIWMIFVVWKFIGELQLQLEVPWI